MTSTTTPGAVAATRPYAVFAVGDHASTLGLPFERLSCGDELIVDVTTAVAARWRREHVTELDHDWHRSPYIDDAWSHTCHLRLHGSAVLVTLHWLTWVDHQPCQGDACGARLCACRDLDGLCAGHRESACRHGLDLCPEHQGECDQCRQGLTS